MKEINPPHVNKIKRDAPFFLVYLVPMVSVGTREHREIVPLLKGDMKV